LLIDNKWLASPSRYPFIFYPERGATSPTFFSPGMFPPTYVFPLPPHRNPLTKTIFFASNPHAGVFLIFFSPSTQNPQSGAVPPPACGLVAPPPPPSPLARHESPSEVTDLTSERSSSNHRVHVLIWPHILLTSFSTKPLLGSASCRRARRSLGDWRGQRPSPSVFYSFEDSSSPPPTTWRSANSFAPHTKPAS